MQNVAGKVPTLPTRAPQSPVVDGALGRNAYRRQHRLVKHEVVGLLRDGMRLSRANLGIRLGENEFGGGRLATAVPKRILKRAIDRNRVKRVIREAFRQHQARGLPVDLLVTLQSLPKSAADVGATAKPVRRQLRQMTAQLLADIQKRFRQDSRVQVLTSA